jgi:hypothetical protein
MAIPRSRSTRPTTSRASARSDRDLEKKSEDPGRARRWPGRFKAILSDQLRVSAAESWETLLTSKPAGRPSPSPELPPASLPLWIVEALAREVGLRPGQIADLAESDARKLIDEVRSRLRG